MDDLHKHFELIFKKKTVERIYLKLINISYYINKKLKTIKQNLFQTLFYCKEDKVLKRERILEYLPPRIDI